MHAVAQAAPGSETTNSARIHAESLLFAPIEPYASGYLNVGSGHQMYWEQCGNPEGVPVAVLHGGPGAGASPLHRRFFDPSFYRIVIFDQRGAGRSQPLGAVEANTPDHLVADIEKLRRHLNIDRWHVFGGSWGAALALCYSVQNPHAVTGLVLRAVFLMSRAETKWFLEGMRRFYPEAWAEFAGFCGVEAHDPDALLNAYHSVLFGPDKDRALEAARRWTRYESACAAFRPQSLSGFQADAAHVLALAQIETHYFRSQMMENQDLLLGKVRAIANHPGIILHGRHDVICPPCNAYDLKAQWPAARLEFIEGAGHTAMDPEMTAALVGATETAKSWPVQS